MGSGAKNLRQLQVTSNFAPEPLVLYCKTSCINLKDLPAILSKLIKYSFSSKNIEGFVYFGIINICEKKFDNSDFYFNFEDFQLK